MTDDSPVFTNEQKADEADMEVGFRLQVYARKAGGADMISPRQRKRISIMEEISAEYRAKANQDALASGETQEDFLNREGFTY